MSFVETLRAFARRDPCGSGGGEHGIKMNRSVGVGVALAILLAVPALADEPSNGAVNHRHAYRHMHGAAHSQRAAPAAHVPPGPAPTVFPAIAPHPRSQDDENGLSRHINDCNKGCIGGNPG